MGMDLYVKRIVGWEPEEDPYVAQTAPLSPITEDVDWWDRQRLVGRRDFVAFVSAGDYGEIVYEEPGMWGYCWSRLKYHEACREWVREQREMAEGNAEQLMRLINESEKDDQIVFRASW